MIHDNSVSDLFSVSGSGAVSIVVGFVDVVVGGGVVENGCTTFAAAAAAAAVSGCGSGS